MRHNSDHVEVLRTPPDPGIAGKRAGGRCENNGKPLPGRLASIVIDVCGRGTGERSAERKVLVKCRRPPTTSVVGA